MSILQQLKNLFEKPNFILEHASGKIGKLVIRQSNGKTYLCSRPVSYNASQKPECVAARNRFKTVSKFASFLYKIPLLTDVWKASGEESLNVFAKIIRDNIKSVEENWPALNNTITPKEHHFKIENVSIDGRDVSIQLEKNFEFDENDKLVVILVFLDPVEKNQEEKFFLLDISPEKICDFIITMDTPEFCRYKKLRYYFTIIRCKDEKLLWSNTFTFEEEIIQ